MRDVAIRHRADGVTELSPKLAGLAGGDRLFVIVGVVFATTGLYLSGLVPPGVAAVVTASCLVGDLLLALKALALAALRPPAEVEELPSLRRRAYGRR